MTDIDSRAIVRAAKRWRDARLAGQAAGIDKRVAELAYRNDPSALASGAQAHYAASCREFTAAQRRERAALQGLEMACVPVGAALSTDDGIEGAS